jgi:hypothetical protein
VGNLVEVDSRVAVVGSQAEDIPVVGSLVAEDSQVEDNRAVVAGNLVVAGSLEVVGILVVEVEDTQVAAGDNLVVDTPEVAEDTLVGEGSLAVVQDSLEGLVVVQGILEVQLVLFAESQQFATVRLRH